MVCWGDTGEVTIMMMLSAHLEPHYCTPVVRDRGGEETQKVSADLSIHGLPSKSFSICENLGISGWGGYIGDREWRMNAGGMTMFAQGAQCSDVHLESVNQ